MWFWEDTDNRIGRRIPKGKHGDKGKTDGLFAHVPGNSFRPNAMFRAFKSSGMVAEKNSYTPTKRDVSPAPLFELILWMRLCATDATRQLPSFPDIEFDPQFVVGKTRRHDDP